MCGKIGVRAIGAGVARFLHTEEVTGSIPVSPTTRHQRLAPLQWRPQFPPSESPLFVTLASEPAITVATDTSGDQLFSDPSVVAIVVNGNLADLYSPVRPGDVVAPVHLHSPQGLEILRHSTAHVLAQAVQKVNPQARLGIGPPITDGFYYDFDVTEPFSSEDLAALEKQMNSIIKSGQRFVRRVVSADEARSELAGEPYKLELVELKGAVALGDAAEGVEVGEGELTIYDNVDTRSGERVWGDLCRGPHLPNTRLIGKGWKLTRVAAAYWRGSEKNPQLQRIYGTAWATEEDLADHLTRLDEAARRDHRKLGVELDLFSFPDEIGSGLAVFHPKGGVIRRVMEDYSRQQHEQAGYEFVYSPHITKGELFETSGHLSWYKEGMFPPIQMDEQRDSSGAITKQGVDYYLKPMNCPFHILIFRSRQRSYRELPLRLFEFGTVYRYEKSGVVHGLTRVRGLTMDDAHIFVTPDDLESELTSLLDFVLRLLGDFGLTDFYLELSTRDENSDKFVGSDELWERATSTLESVATRSGLTLVPDPGGAAFYGPKISVQAKDAIGRSWQMSTIQLDFTLPERFELEYQAADGTRQTPIMIHRALFGSIERFFGVLTEHYAGAFPAWLSPVQVVGIPVADEYAPYMAEVIEALSQRGVRAELDDSDDRMPKKIRNHTMDKVPFLLIAGEDDRAAGAVSFRFRDGSQKNGVAIKDAIDEIVTAIETRAHG
jgi:threonyl-tRNA synthetase